MFEHKLTATLVLLIGVISANIDAQNVTALKRNDQESLITRPDDYINLNRRNYEYNIRYYDAQMDNFKKDYTNRVATIETQMGMLLDAIEQADELWNPMELLSDFSKDCVRKYRYSVPTTTTTKSSITSCVSTAISSLNSLLASALNTRNTLQNYYTGTYDKGITNCDTKFKDHPLNYTSCITALTSSANSYTVSNQKTFAVQMDSAECSASAYTKRSLDCNFAIHKSTISRMAEANALITKCMSGQSDCKPCREGFSCPDVYYLKKHEIDYKNSTMPNPFYGRHANSSCLMLEVYEYNRILS